MRHTRYALVTGVQTYSLPVYDADMAEEEDQVAPLGLVASYVGFGTERRELEVAVALQLHAGGAPRKLDQPRTVDALARTPAPDIGGADQRLGHRRGIGFDGVDLDERRHRQIAMRGREPFALAFAHHQRPARQNRRPAACRIGRAVEDRLGGVDTMGRR